MNAVEFTKWMAEQDITEADEKAVYYMALLWIHKAKEAANALGGESDIKRPEMASDATLRDYFAAKFMQGVCANPDRLYDNEPLAKEAYAMADAMLKARE